MALSQDIIDVVADVNLKQMGEMHAAQTSLMREEAVGHYQRLNKIAEAAVTRGIKGLVEIDPSEARSASQLLTGNAVSENALSHSLAAAVAQILSKTGGNAPPVTP